MTPIASLRALRVLVAGDDRLNQRLVVRILEHLGHHAEVARTGVEALAAVASLRFDLVFMDVRMPILDGVATAAAIRRREARSEDERLPIIALTGADLAVDEARCLAAGMDRCLTKPVKTHEVAGLLTWVASRPCDSDAHGATEASPAVDVATIESYRADGDAFFEGLIEAFLTELPQRIATMETGHQTGDTRAVRAAAHALRGSARVFGAQGLADICQRIEEDATAVTLAALQSEARRVRSALAELRPAKESVR